MRWTIPHRSRSGVRRKWHDMVVAHRNATLQAPGAERVSGRATSVFKRAARPDRDDAADASRRSSSPSAERPASVPRWATAITSASPVRLDCHERCRRRESDGIRDQIRKHLRQAIVVPDACVVAVELPGRRGFRILRVAVRLEANGLMTEPLHRRPFRSMRSEHSIGDRGSGVGPPWPAP